MPFTVGDFQDLLHLLEEHPEWRVRLRQHVLPEGLLEVPELVRGLADAQRRTDEQLAILTARIDSLTARLDSLTARLDSLTARLDSLTDRLDSLTDRLDSLTARLDSLTGRLDSLAAQFQTLVGRVGAMDGELMELRFARRAAAYLGRLARRIRVVDPSRLADVLDDAVEAGRLTETEWETIMLTDVVAFGRRRIDDEEAYFVTEVSAGIGVSDVRRALERAQLLAKVDQATVPVVAGRWINDDAQQYARSSQVELILMPRTASSGDEPPLA